ncbi:MAG: hypothetical protein IJ679_09665 [Lachnospiraceae bacterium]|nr:hypothetical protein [Lachnospiraceae bacterium]
MLTSKQALLCDIFINQRENTTLEESTDPYYLKHLSPIRWNLLEWMNFSGDEAILEIGGSTGLMTQFFCEKARKVISVVEDSGEAYVNGIRNRSYKNLSICTPKVESIPEYSQWTEEIYMESLEGCAESFNLVAMIGVGESVLSYLNTICSKKEDSGTIADPFLSALKFAALALKSNGRLILALNNRIGLQYFAGKTDAACPHLFDSIQKNRESRQEYSFTKNRLDAMLESAGFQNLEYFYPVPDYLYPSMLYSDRYLPKAGDVRPTSTHYDQERYQFFDEKKAFDSLCEDGLFDVFANSFLVLAERS